MSNEEQRPAPQPPYDAGGQLPSGWRFDPTVVEETLAPPAVDGRAASASVAAMADLLRDVGAAVSGYRSQLIGAGWSEPVAEQIAAAALLAWQHRLLGGCRG